MPIYVYVFAGSDRLLGFTTDRTGENLPQSLGPWALRNRLIMSEGDDHRSIVRTQECLDDIEMYGYHLTKEHRRVTDVLDA